MNKKIKDGVEGFKLTKAARDILRQKKADTGLSKTQIVEDLILGKRQFAPLVETLIERAMLKRGMSRQDYLTDCIMRNAFKDLGEIDKDTPGNNGLG